MKKFAALFLVLTFIVACAAACKKNPTPNPDITVNTTTTEATTTSGGTGTTGNQGAETTETTPAETTTTVERHKEVKDGDFLYRILKDDDGKYYAAAVINWSGNGEALVIPSTYTYKDTTYDVIRIGSNSNARIGQSIHNIKELTIPASVKTISSGAFLGALKLEKINFAEGLEAIGEMTFWCCGSLKELTLPSTLKEIGANAFQGCTSIESIIVPSSVTTIGKGAFSGCSSLKTVTLPEAFRAQESEIFNGSPNVQITYVG